MGESIVALFEGEILGLGERVEKTSEGLGALEGKFAVIVEVTNGGFEAGAGIAIVGDNESVEGKFDVVVTVLGSAVELEHRMTSFLNKNFTDGE